MASGDTRTRPLEGPGSDRWLADVRRRFRAVGRGPRISMRVRRRLGDLGRGLLIVYWLGCVAVIAAGVNRADPDLWPTVQRALPGPHIDHPFANCRAAHAAGVYDIPFWSPGYTSAQDGDGDGKACEPGPGERGYWAMARLR